MELKDESGLKIMTEIVELRAKNYSYFIDYGSKDIKAKGTKKCVIKTKLKFENYNNCLEATQLEKKKTHLEKNKTDIDSLKKDHKKSIKSNKLILKIQQRFKRKRHNVLTEETNKIALSSSDDKGIQSIDSIQPHADGKSCNE